MEARRAHVPGGAAPSAKTPPQPEGAAGHTQQRGSLTLCLPATLEMNTVDGSSSVYRGLPLATHRPIMASRAASQQNAHARGRYTYGAYTYVSGCTGRLSCVSVSRIEKAGCDLGSNAGGSCGHGDLRGAPLVRKEWNRDKHTRVVQEGARVEEPGEGLARLGIAFAEPHCLTAGGAGGWMGWRCNAKSKNTRVHRMYVRAMQCTVSLGVLESRRSKVAVQSRAARTVPLVVPSMAYWVYCTARKDDVAIGVWTNG